MDWVILNQQLRNMLEPFSITEKQQTTEHAEAFS
jgi:hypothetical protein